MKILRAVCSFIAEVFTSFEGKCSSIKELIDKDGPAAK